MLRSTSDNFENSSNKELQEILGALFLFLNADELQRERFED